MQNETAQYINYLMEGQGSINYEELHLSSLDQFNSYLNELNSNPVLSPSSSAASTTPILSPDSLPTTNLTEADLSRITQTTKDTIHTEQIDGDRDALLNENIGLKASLRKSESLLTKLQAEAKASIERAKSVEKRNESVLEAIKQKYYINTPEVESVVSVLIESYEAKLKQSYAKDELSEVFSEVQLNSPKASTPKASPIHSNPLKEDGLDKVQDYRSLESAYRLIKKELDRSREECDVLRLRLINEAGNDDSGLTTRERIQRDKKGWRMKGGQLSGMDDSEVRSVLKEICTKLGIREYSDIALSVSKIDRAFNLIPQLEMYANEINTLINTHHVDMDVSTTSTNGRMHKLKDSLVIVQGWADSAALGQEREAVMEELHQILGINEQIGSMEVCLAEVSKLVKRANQTTQSQGDVLTHFEALFNVQTSAQTIAKMNELYVFWAEANDGLMRLRRALKLDRYVQAGRVLIHASEAIEEIDRIATPTSMRSAPNI